MQPLNNYAQEYNYKNLETFVLNNEEGKYSGHLENGKRSGLGICIFKDGSIYKGEWKEDQFHGYGELTKSNNEYLKGTWKEGKFYSGYLTLFNYTGYMDKGVPHGLGILRINGNVHDGKFDHGKFLSGKGILNFKNFWYEGELLGDEPHGQGVFHLDNGDEIKGTFENGVFISGSGTKSYLEGHKYRGELRGDAPQGFGKMHFANGDMQEGIWDNEEFISGKVVHTYTEDGVYSGIYRGEWKKGAPHGYGMEILSDEMRNGLWEEGKFRSGQVKLKLTEGIYEGEIINNDINGWGRLTKPDGTVEIGIWVNGKLHKGHPPAA